MTLGSQLRLRPHPVFQVHKQFVTSLLLSGLQLEPARRHVKSYQKLSLDRSWVLPYIDIVSIAIQIIIENDVLLKCQLQKNTLSAGFNICVVLDPQLTRAIGSR